MTPRPILAAAALMLLLPLASAGGYDASVEYLESDSSGCGTDSWSYDYYGNESWGTGHYQWTRCDESFTYGRASVSDEDGDIASFDSGTDENSTQGHNHHSSSHSSSEHSYSSYQSSTNNASAAARHATLTTREGDATVSDGCSNSYGYGYYNSWYGGDFGYGETNSGQSSGDHYSSANGCRTSATAARGDDAVTLTPHEQGCAYSDSSSSTTHSSTWDNSTSESTWASETSSDKCREGASLQAGEHAVDAGGIYGCEANSNSYSNSWDGGNASTYTSDNRACQNGILVTGPDGMTVFVGSVSYDRSYCNNDSCYGSTYDDTFVMVAWAHSPFGPNPLVATVPTYLLA